MEHAEFLFAFSVEEVGALNGFPFGGGVDVEGVEEVEEDGDELLRIINILGFYLRFPLFRMCPQLMQRLLTLEEPHHLVHRELLRNLLPPQVVLTAAHIIIELQLDKQKVLFLRCYNRILVEVFLKGDVAAVLLFDPADFVLPLELTEQFFIELLGIEH